MASLLRNRDVRLISAGINVTRTTATLPATALGSIFTVSGGRVLLVYVTGMATSALGATATTLSIGITPAGGTSAPAVLGTATAVTSLAANGVIMFNPGGATVVSANGSALPAARYVAPAGAITITTSATDTGSVQWDLCYIPVDNGAQVVAA